MKITTICNQYSSCHQRPRLFEGGPVGAPFTRASLPGVGGIVKRCSTAVLLTFYYTHAHTKLISVNSLQYWQESLLKCKVLKKS